MGIRDTAAGASPKPRKQWGGREALTVKTACREMDNPLVQCWEENECQQWSAVVFWALSRWSLFPTDVATYLICPPENLRHVYLFANCVYLYRQSNFGGCRWCRQGVFSEWQNVEMCSLRM